MMTKQEFEKMRSDWKRDYPVEKVYKVFQNFLFHYTTRENLWNIIESDSMYARNVRFSNDSEEYTIGKKIIEEALKKRISNVDDCYMVCFCEEDNILSQWREYARGGVSIMMDLSEDTVYTIKVSKEIEKQNEKKHPKESNNSYHIPWHKYQYESEYAYAYTKPICVKYINPQKNNLKKEIGAIREEIKGNKEMLEERCLKTLIPYIKHIGFSEEKEVRLIFKVDGKAASSLVGYLNNDGICRPYIRVEMGDASRKEELGCQVGLYGITDVMKNTIKKGLKNGKLKIKESDEKDKEIEIEFEEMSKGKFPDEKSSIYIGNCKYQEYVFDYFDHYVESHNIKDENKINIWCEGHLPIRKITVGPSNDKEEFRESIEHKKRNIYWLKYVQVNVSDIPYRSNDSRKQ